MLGRFLSHHILANLTFVLVLSMGIAAYLNLPRQQDPTVNFNWLHIVTIVPGASATDVEKRVTSVLEEGIQKVADVKFSSSTSREGLSSIIVRFLDLPPDRFQRRLSDLRREIQNSESDLPPEALKPDVLEITSSNAFPSGIVVAVGQGDEESLRRQARIVEEDLARFGLVDRVDAIGLQDPELQVLFEPDRLVGLEVTPVALAETVSAYFRDMAAGAIPLGTQEWLVRFTGTDNDPTYLAELPILTAAGEIPLRSVAEVVRGREPPTQLVLSGGEPAVMFAVFKRMNANVIDLVDQIREYVAIFNERSTAAAGVSLILVDDQTTVTRQALGVMERNAALGFLLVLLVTWIFLGAKIAVLTTIGIPFILAGTFWTLSLLGQTLNVIALLGVVISLGMLVDDAVVVAEAILVRIRQGRDAVEATIDALREVASPVTASVLTTIAAFLPLTLMPGVLGRYMQVAPMVVITALLLSLIEAFWMLPTHIVAAHGKGRSTGNFLDQKRLAAMRAIRRRYARVLVKAMRHPLFMVSVLVVAGAASAVLSGFVRVEFFATDAARQFYVNVAMPPGADVKDTLRVTRRHEQSVLDTLRDDELFGSATYAGIRFTEKEPMHGDQHGQVLISLAPKQPNGRTVDQIIEEARSAVHDIPGPLNVSFLRVIRGAPPTSKPLSVKVRGDNPDEIFEATTRIRALLEQIPGVTDIADDYIAGRNELALRLNADAMVRAGMNPHEVTRALRLFVDGEIVAGMRDRGEQLDVRVRAKVEPYDDVEGFLRNTLGLSDGSSINLGRLLDYEVSQGPGNIRHYNFRRAVTVEADLDKSRIDTLAANTIVRERWASEFASQFPGVELDFTGELDDIQESLDAMAVLFAFGLGLIYLILGTQFRSYVQPIIVLAAIPMAFTGVIFGLAATGNPISVYTLYGMIALAGIGVNSAIVLISAANDRLRQGMSVAHATVFAARRRVVPILITSLTTMGGLFSLATGLGGESLIWGPLATSIVWGLGVSTLLTLFVMPMLYAAVASTGRKGPASGELLEAPAGGASQAWLRTLGMAPKSPWGMALAAVEGNPELMAVYQNGRSALAIADFEKAIRIFEPAAKAQRDNGVLQAHAALALLEFMERRFGPDGGFLERARLFLERAEKLLPEDERVERLRESWERLREAFDEGSGGS